MEYYTEKEAVLKICPLIYASHSHCSTCQASRCMKWEWFYDRINIKDGVDKISKTYKGGCGL